VRSIHPDDRTVVDGIPVTSVSRTLLDLAETESPLASSVRSSRRKGWTYSTYGQSRR
jgi:hypothetical protein